MVAPALLMMSVAASVPLAGASLSVRVMVPFSVAFSVLTLLTTVPLLSVRARAMVGAVVSRVALSLGAASEAALPKPSV